MPPYPNLDHCHPHPKPHPHPPSPVSPRHQLAVTLTSPLGPIIVPLPPQIKKQKPSLLQFFYSSAATSASEGESSSPSDVLVVVLPTQRQPIKILRVAVNTIIPPHSWNRRPPRPPSIKLSSSRDRRGLSTQQSNMVIRLGGLRGGVAIREYNYDDYGIGMSNGRKSNNNKGNVMAVVDCNFTYVILQATTNTFTNE